jgi:hypothetical protein
MCSAPTCHVTNVRPSIDSPHQVVISCRTPEYQYPWFRFYCDSIFFQHAGCCRWRYSSGGRPSIPPSATDPAAVTVAAASSETTTHPPSSVGVDVTATAVTTTSDIANDARYDPAVNVNGGSSPASLVDDAYDGGQGTRWCNQLSCLLSRLPQNHLCVRISRE